MLETILNQNGVGYKQLNPFLRELYLLKQDNRRGEAQLPTLCPEIKIFPDDARICFMLTPDSSQIKRIWVLQINSSTQILTAMQMLGRDILIIASVAEIRDVLKLMILYRHIVPIESIALSL